MRNKQLRHNVGPVVLTAIILLAMAIAGAPAQENSQAPSPEPQESPIAATEQNTEPQEEGLRLNFQGAELDTVLDYLSKAAGFIIVREATVEGRIDVLSHQPLSKDEAVSLLNTVLNQKGYAAIRNGRTLTIVTRENALTRNIPVRKGADPESIPSTDEMVTQVIPIRYADAMKLVTNLEMLIPKDAVVTANESSNAIVLTDTQTNVRRIAEIVRALDTSISSITDIRVFQLKHANAVDIAKVVTELFEASQSSSGQSREDRMREFFSRMRGGPGGGPGGDQNSSNATGQSEARQAASKVVAVADERTNALVVGAPGELMPTIEALVAQVDKVTEEITEVRVFTLKYADAEEMATVITGVFDANAQSSSNNSSSRFRSPFFRGFGGGSQESSTENQSERKVLEERVVAKADVRTNSVVVSASATLMEQIAGMVRNLDANPAKERKVFLYPVQNADPEVVRDILSNMFQESSSSGSNRSSTSNSSRSSSNSSSSSRTNRNNSGSSGLSSDSSSRMGSDR